jgi:ferrochelatase
LKRAVVLMNMGGPNNISEVKVFLKNMFNDKYIIGAPQPIRALIGQIIISKRLRESQENYKKFRWNVSNCRSYKKIGKKIK